MKNPFNGYKILRHLDVINTYINGNTVFPISLELAPSNLCNHDCGWCSYKEFRNDKPVIIERWKELIEDVIDIHPASITITGGGEPFMHPNLMDMITMLVAAGIEVGLFTNGSMVPRDAFSYLAEHLTFIRFSLDAYDDETHRIIHGVTGQFESILDNLAGLCAAKSKGCTIGTSFIICDENCSLEGISRLMDRLVEMGVDYIQFKPEEHTPATAEHVRVTELLVEKYTRSINIFPVRMHDDPNLRCYDSCRIHNFVSCISADGEVAPCCQLQGIQSFGNVETERYRDILQKARPEIDVSVCPPCRYNRYNELLEVICSELNHEKFI